MEYGLIKQDDKAWESVMEFLSGENRLQKFCKVPRHELHAMIKIFGPRTSQDLAKMFLLTHARRFSERQAHVEYIGEQRSFAMLYVLGRAMKCWVETDYFNSPHTYKNSSRWKVAHC